MTHMLPPESGGGTLFSDLARWAGRRPARWLILGLSAALAVALLACAML